MLKSSHIVKPGTWALEYLTQGWNKMNIKNLNEYNEQAEPES